MNFNVIEKMRWALLCGKALKCFEKSKFKVAVPLFEKIIKIESVNFRRELMHYYLGRSYLAIGENCKALENFTSSYAPFRQRVVQLKYPNDLYHFRVLASEYIKLLDLTGQINLAKKIKLDRNKLLEWQDE